MNRRDALKHTALLFGVAASPATLTRALAEIATGDSATPRYFTRSHYKIVTALADRLLPTGDTPGALEAGVPAYIDVAYGLFMPEADQNNLRTGLAHLDYEEFDALTGSQQDAVIRAIAEHDAKPGKGWLRQFRWVCFNGYFTSEAAAKSGFKWDPVPGGYEPCMPLADTGGVSYFE